MSYDWIVQESRAGSDSRWWMTGNKFKEKKHKRELVDHLLLISSYLCSRPKTSPRAGWVGARCVSPLGEI